MRTARSSTRRGRSPPGTPKQAPPGTRPPEQAPPRTGTPQSQQPLEQAPLGAGTPPPPCGQTHTCKHITLPQTSFAGGKYINVSEQRDISIYLLPPATVVVGR